MKRIKNITETDLLHNSGQNFPVGEYVSFDPDIIDRIADYQLKDWFEAGYLVFNDGTNDQSYWLNGWLHFSGIRYPDSVAVDLVESEDEEGVTSGTDQELTGSDWVKVEPKRVIWGINNDWDLENNSWSPTVNGIFFHDPQIRIKNLVNVTCVELGIFVDDELWWISDQRYPSATLTQLILRGAVHIDAYVGSQIDIRVRLTGDSPSATIDWDDDWTAWGFALKDLLL